MPSRLFRRLVVAMAPVGAVALLAGAPTWTVQTSGAMSTLRGVSAVSDQIAWASGSGSTLLHTVDGGATWQKVVVTPDRVDFRDVDAIDARTAYVLSIGNGPASRIYKTMDGGATWTPSLLNEDPKVFLDAMSWWDASHGIVIGDAIDGQFCILTTSDGGQTWARVPASALPAAQPNEGAFAASGTNIAVFGQDAWIGTGAAATARVLHTPDRGKTWSVATTPLRSGTSAGIFSVAFRDTRHGVVVGGDYRLEKDAVDNVAVTSDGGATWTLVKDHALSGFRSVVTYQPGAGLGVVLVAVGPQGADWSNDDGRTWSPIPGPGFHTFSFSPSGTMGWGAGNRGAIGRLDVK
jgi:photosystem II stability/assembly factor-like uncharacterized protein